MASLTPITDLEEEYPYLHHQVREKLAAAGHDPQDFIVTSAHHSDERVEASYYPRTIADEHRRGNYTVPNYHWVAVDAVRADHGFAHLHVRVLEEGGWIG